MGGNKFTKGPWVSGVLSIKDADEYSVDCDLECGWGYVGTDSNCVALVVTKDGDDVELDANISIIAAAPEMYEALEDAADLLFQCPDEESANFGSAIRDLLAKARGEK